MALKKKSESEAPEGEASHLVLNSDQLQCLASPVRGELLEVIGELGSCSVAELAHHLGKGPHTLYYHLAKLEEVGLVACTGARRAGRRDERLYDVVTHDFYLPRREADSETRQLLFRMAASSLRTAMREHRDNIDEPEWAEFAQFVRTSMRLKKEDAREFRRKIRDAINWANSRRTKDDDSLVLSFTSVVTPKVKTTSASDDEPES
jgi:predicted transcriptional regulator